VFLIDGHTDARASDAYNMDLSQRRANAVAAIAAETGANVQQVRAFGERKPRATNATRDGMAMNRRVEILCVR
jgi:outer membrane protein OmpA-like peptidoglycan-associated protein